MSMIRPIPFWPSLDPCAKLTPVQVRTSKPRIHQGGDFPWAAGSYNSRFGIKSLARINSNAEQVKPTIGDTRRAVNTSWVFAQLTPSPKTWPGDISELASATPIIEPINVCELEAGRPRYQVPTFQMIADIKSANTIANPAPEPTFRTSSTGRSANTANATPPPEVRTPIRFQHPDQITAMAGRSERV